MPKSILQVQFCASFDEESDPVVIGDETVKAFVDLAPAFDMKGVRYGPYSAQSVELPAYAATYLLARGLGRIAVN